MNKFIVIVMLLGFFSTSLITPVQASHGLISHIGGIVATPIGAGVGALRGALSNGLSNKDTLVKQFPVILTPITMPLGIVMGTGLGAVSGTLKGATDGYHIGHDKPLSLDSFSLTGDFFNYDPYAVTL